VQKLVSVNFTGHRALAESLLHQTANFQVNAEFQEELVPRAAEAIRAAYHRIGYRRATVTPVRTPVKDGVALQLGIEEGPVTRIAEVRFTGDLALHRDELLAAFKLQPGDVLNLSALDDGVRGVRGDTAAPAGCGRGRVAPLRGTAAAGVRVIVPVNAGPVVRFHMRGNHAFPDALLVAQLGLSHRRRGRAGRLADGAGDGLPAAPLLRGAGLLRARIAEREIRARDGAVELVFSIDEDRPVASSRSSSTATARSPARSCATGCCSSCATAWSPTLRRAADPWSVDSSQVAGRLPEPRRPRTRTEPETVFDPVLYARALKQIEDFYKSQGYLSVRAGPPRPEALGGDAHRLRVTIR